MVPAGKAMHEMYWLGEEDGDEDGAATYHCSLGGE